MSNLIERLRDRYSKHSQELRDEAADEIERLRSTLKGVLACCREPHGLGDSGRLSAIHTITNKALEGYDE